MFSLEVLWTCDEVMCSFVEPNVDGYVLITIVRVLNVLVNIVSITCCCINLSRRLRLICNLLKVTDQRVDLLEEEQGSV